MPEKNALHEIGAVVFVVDNVNRSVEPTKVVSLTTKKTLQEETIIYELETHEGKTLISKDINVFADMKQVRDHLMKQFESVVDAILQSTEEKSRGFAALKLTEQVSQPFDPDGDNEETYVILPDGSRARVREA